MGSTLVLRPGEYKQLIVEIFDSNNKAFRKDYKYRIYASFSFYNKTISFRLNEFEVIGKRTLLEKNAYLRRKGDRALENGDYPLALDSLFAVLNSQIENNYRFKNKKYDYLFHQAILLSQIVKAYEKSNDFRNAKKYTLKWLVFSDKMLDHLYRLEYNINTNIERDKIEYEEFLKLQKDKKIKKTKRKVEILEIGENANLRMRNKLKEYDKMILKEKAGGAD